MRLYDRFALCAVLMLCLLLTATGLRAESFALDTVLNEADVARYAKIFDLQEAGRMRAADREIKALDSDLLMGHVLAQRYLHRTAWRSKYTELRDWLARYGDHPDADRLYRLAIKRRPANHRYPARATYATGAPRIEKPEGSARPPMKRVTREGRRLERKVINRLRNGFTKSAKREISTKRAARLLGQYRLDRLRARLASGYFGHGRDQWALDWATKAAKHSGEWLSEAHWIAGMASWRLGRHAEAAGHFERAATAKDGDAWTHAAGAFWAARSHLVGRRPEQVSTWLAKAAAHPETFYGLIAVRLLGRPTGFDWQLGQDDYAEMNRLMTETPVRRALALAQVGQFEQAERELRGLGRKVTPENARAFLAIAAEGGMPRTAIRLANWFYPNGGGYLGASYPLPGWEPAGGFRVDRALVYALIRQESRFNPKARSRAGARGLMQLMPGTASFVAKDRTYRRGSGRKKLFDPKTNLTLGQSYLEMLRDDALISGDLFKMAAAWNGGPGNLNKWHRDLKHGDDPLLFIESIPARETRRFIERVLTNLWIYRDRLGQDQPSLDAIAANAWPVYIAKDTPTTEVARHVAD
ncbi:MAG: lytic transglycosylase domain-containing protein [Magnetovibrionaceae bacterium]